MLAFTGGFRFWGTNMDSGTGSRRRHGGLGFPFYDRFLALPVTALTLIAALLTTNLRIFALFVEAVLSHLAATIALGIETFVRRERQKGDDLHQEHF